MSRFATKEDLIEIMRGISEKVPTGGGGISSWQPETEYVEGQVILHDKFLYKVIEDFTSGTEFDDSSLEMIGGGEGLKEWQAEKEYEEGNILVYEGQIYIALVKFTSGTTFDKTEILEEYTLAGGETPITWAEGQEINIDDIVEYDGNYYKALVDFTCGKEFTTVALEEYVPQPLTEEQIEEIIDAYEPEFDGGTGGENYSIEEQRIGTWVDGKPLYQVTIVTTTPATASPDYSPFLDISAYNIDTLVKIDGITANAVSLNYHDGNTRCLLYYGSGTLSIIVTDAFKSAPLVITLQYTKTTD